MQTGAIPRDARALSEAKRYADALLNRHGTRFAARHAYFLEASKHLLPALVYAAAWRPQGDLRTVHHWLLTRDQEDVAAWLDMVGRSHENDDRVRADVTNALTYLEHVGMTSEANYHHIYGAAAILVAIALDEPTAARETTIHARPRGRWLRRRRGAGTDQEADRALCPETPTTPRTPAPAEISKAQPTAVPAGTMAPEPPSTPMAPQQFHDLQLGHVQRAILVLLHYRVSLTREEMQLALARNSQTLDVSVAGLTKRALIEHDYPSRESAYRLTPQGHAARHAIPPSTGGENDDD